MAAAGSFASLSEAALTSRSDLVMGIVMEVVKEGGILDQLPTRVVKGTNLTYNRENVLPSGQFHAIADTWTASEDIDFTQITTTLAIHGDEKRLDDFIAKTYVSDNDPVAIVTQQTSRGLKQRIERALVYESTNFSGLHSLVTTNQTLNQGSGGTGAAATVTNTNRMADLVRPHADIVLAPLRLAQRMDQVGQGVNSAPLVSVQLQNGKGELRLGQKATYWRDVTIQRTDYMATTGTGALQESISGGAYSAETGGATGTIFAIRFGLPEAGGCFLAIGDNLFEMVGPEESENFNGQWFRIRSYLALGIGSTRCLAAEDGITDVAMTA